MYACYVCVCVGLPVFVCSAVRPFVCLYYCMGVLRKEAAWRVSGSVGVDGVSNDGPRHEVRASAMTAMCDPRCWRVWHMSQTPGHTGTHPYEHPDTPGISTHRSTSRHTIVQGHGSTDRPPDGGAAGQPHVLGNTHMCTPLPHTHTTPTQHNPTKHPTPITTLTHPKTASIAPTNHTLAKWAP